MAIWFLLKYHNDKDKVTQTAVPSDGWVMKANLDIKYRMS